MIMINDNRGFSLVEMLLVIAIIGFVLAAGSDMFISMLRTSKQQTRITESNIEGIIGLQMLRRDIESAGYGLPWNMSGTIYQEAASAVPAAYNDSPSNAPRAVLAGNNVTESVYVNGTDYLVLKGVNLANNKTCTKWTNLVVVSGMTTTTVWDTPKENFTNSERIIVISPGSLNESEKNKLITVAGSFFTNVDSLSGWSSSDESRVIYGVDGDSDLRMPFNRADYYVSKTTIPGRCAPGTGVLKKGVLPHASGEFSGTSVFPLLDCVADMQVVASLDTDDNGTTDTISDGLFLSDAKTVRDQLKEVRVYILAQVGQRDKGYKHPNSTMRVGEMIGGTVYGRDFNLAGKISNWQEYRWKLYTLVVRMMI